MPCHSSSPYNCLNLADHFSRFGTSFARWCPDSGRTQHCCIMPAYAHLLQQEAFAIEQDQPIPFTGPNIISDSVEDNSGLLALPAPGIYHVRYRVHIPMGTSANTSFVLRLDGVDVPGTLRTVMNGAGEVTAEAIIEICDPAVLGLYSTAALTLPAAPAGEALATLTVMGL